METYISKQWLNWIDENLRRGCSLSSILQTLTEQGIDAESAGKAISLLVRNENSSEVLINPYQVEGSHVQAGNSIPLVDREVDVVLRMNAPDLVVIDNFIDAEECDALVELANARLKRSVVIDRQDGSEVIDDIRTSHGMHFRLAENDLVKRLDLRIASLVNMPVENGEGLEVINYQPGTNYEPHFDFFSGDDPGYQTHLGKGGDRVATVIIYLNDVVEGGETVFPNLRLNIVPRRGSAVYFSYLNSTGQVDKDTLHGGAPVIKGEKWIANKCLRQGAIDT